MKNIGIVGARGLVGRSLSASAERAGFNSIAIDFRTSRDYEKSLAWSDVVFFCCFSGAKRFVDISPEVDFEAARNMVSVYADCCDWSAKDVFLVSTVDVYKNTTNKAATKETCLTKSGSDYGGNRSQLEKYTRSKIENVTCLRLPGLLSRDIAKNAIYDLQHQRGPFISLDSELNFIDMESSFDCLFRGLQELANCDSVNFCASESVSLRYLYKKYECKNFSKVVSAAIDLPTQCYQINTDLLNASLGIDLGTSSENVDKYWWYSRGKVC